MASPSPLNLILGPAAPEEVAELGKVYERAVGHLALHRLIFKVSARVEDRINMQVGRIEAAWNDPLASIVVARDATTGQIYGYILWRELSLGDELPASLSTIQDSLKEEDNGDAFQTGKPASAAASSGNTASQAKKGPPMNKELMNYILKELTDMYLADMRGVRHILLDHLYVLPEVAGHGIGTKLIKQCTDAADKVGLVTYVSASPAATELYRRMGFNETRHIDVDLSRFARPNSGYGLYRETHLLRPCPTTPSA